MSWPWTHPDHIPSDAVGSDEPRLITDAERRLVRAALGLVAARETSANSGIPMPDFGNNHSVNRQLDGLTAATLDVRQELTDDWDARHPAEPVAAATEAAIKPTLVNA